MIQKSRYRIPNQKEFRRLEQSVNLIYQTADYFQEYFVGRKMVYSTQKNEVELYFLKQIICIYVDYTILKVLRNFLLIVWIKKLI